MVKLLIASIVMGTFILSGCGAKPEVEKDLTHSKNSNKSTKVVQVDKKLNEVKLIDEAKTVDNTSVKSDNLNTVSLKDSIQSIYFDYDKFDLSENMQEVALSNYKILHNYSGEYKVILEGNCDEWGSDEYNYALGVKRADSVKKAMVSFGIADEKLSIISYGESDPKCSAHTKECWDKNRRVDYKIK